MLKNLTILMIALLSLVPAAFSKVDSTGNEKVDHSKLFRAYDACLSSDNVGVSESAVFIMIQYKERYPELDYSKILRTLASLERTAGDPTLGYKAHLVSMYLKYGSEMHITLPESREDHETVYRVIAQQLENKFLTSNLPR